MGRIKGTAWVAVALTTAALVASLFKLYEHGIICAIAGLTWAVLSLHEKD